MRTHAPFAQGRAGLVLSGPQAARSPADPRVASGWLSCPAGITEGRVGSGALGGGCAKLAGFSPGEWARVGLGRAWNPSGTPLPCVIASSEQLACWLANLGFWEDWLRWFV